MKVVVLIKEWFWTLMGLAELGLVDYWARFWPIRLLVVVAAGPVALVVVVTKEWFWALMDLAELGLVYYQARFWPVGQLAYQYLVGLFFLGVGCFRL